MHNQMWAKPVFKVAITDYLNQTNESPCTDSGRNMNQPFVSMLQLNVASSICIQTHHHFAIVLFVVCQFMWSRAERIDQFNLLVKLHHITVLLLSV